MKAGRDSRNGFSRARNVAVVSRIIAGPRNAANVRYKVSVALMPTGGGEVVARLVGQQRHKRIHQCGLAASGGADNGGAFGVYVRAVTTAKGPQL